MCFTDFSYNHEVENAKGGFVHALEVLETMKTSTHKAGDKKVTSIASTEIETQSNKLSENISDVSEKRLTRQESKKALQRINFSRINYVRQNTTDSMSQKKIDFSN